ncbi:MAG: YbhB/YbcL family Raf kinase inhibitor-like protein [Firmicutes bacterium]|nr:YbhB/YbcL family Raf kinase inhibitor-like protein [Bacillota bacterium]
MFQLTSQGIQNHRIAPKYGCHGDCMEGVPQLSIPLAWSGFPENTVSFALVFQDYDNIPEEGFSWIHWLAADIPCTQTRLPEDASRRNHSLIQGRNSWMAPFPPYKKEKSITDYYGGPAPEQPHNYEFRLFALDRYLHLKPGFYYNQLLSEMKGHILDEAVLSAIYKP